MDENFLREVAAQLRKPSGKFGNEVAENMNVSNKTMNLAAIDALTLHDDETLLEIGMANGAFVPKILSLTKNMTYIGVDYSEDMIKLAANLNHEFIESGNAKFLIGEISELPVQTDSIDNILTVNTIYFWEDADIALQEVNRVLRSGGKFVIAFRPEGCLRKYPSTQFNFQYYEISDVEQLLNQHGFEVFSVQHNSEPEMEVLEKTIIPEYAIVVGKKTT